MEKSGFFNSVNGDRKYGADFFAEFFASFIGTGVYPNPSTGLQAITNNNMTITLRQGKAWINGRYYINDSDLVLSVDVADGVLNRIDRIVTRKDTIKRKTYSYVKKGKFASSPVVADLQRDADAYEIALADIYIKAGAISITQSDITDLRLNKELCGIVHGVVDQVDTTTIFNQYLDWFHKIKGQATNDIGTMQQQFKQDFNLWFDRIKDVLDGNTAGNLLNLINKNSDSIESCKAQLSDMATKKADKTEVQTVQSTASTALSKANEAFTLGDSTKKDVVGILSSKGLEGLTTSSDWEKIKGIMQNMSLGKKFATGHVVGYTNASTLPKEQLISVRNLSFQPSIVFLGSEGKKWTKFIFLSNLTGFPINTISCSDSNSVYWINEEFAVNPTGYYVHAIRNDGFSVTCSVCSSNTPEYTWVAIE